VRAAVNAFRGRVEGVIQEDGGHIEWQLFFYNP
jgi:hypothetical protein